MRDDAEDAVCVPAVPVAPASKQNQKSVLMQGVGAARALQRTAVCVEQMHRIAADSQNVVGCCPKHDGN